MACRTQNDDRFEVFTRHVERQNAREVMNAAMSAEVELVVGGRAEGLDQVAEVLHLLPVDLFQYLPDGVAVPLRDLVVEHLVGDYYQLLSGESDPLVSPSQHRTAGELQARVQLQIGVDGVFLHRGEGQRAVDEPGGLLALELADQPVVSLCHWQR